MDYLFELPLFESFCRSFMYMLLSNGTVPCLERRHRRTVYHRHLFNYLSSLLSPSLSQLIYERELSNFI